MNTRLSQLAEVIPLALLAWFGYQLLHRVQPLLVIGLVLIVGCNVVVMWLLRFDRDRLAPLYVKPYVQHYLKWVCYWAGEQPPVQHPAASAHAEFLLHSDEDFRNAGWRAKQVLFGHDLVVDQLLWRIRDAVALRKRRRDGACQPPLGSFLLVGGEGIGKRHLARVLAKLLYRSGSVLAFECDKLPLGSLPASLGELVESVRRQPFQLILFERIDVAPPDLLQELQLLLTRGSHRETSSGREISFQNTIIVMTTTKATAPLAILAGKSLTDRAWHEQALAAVCSETGIEPTFLHAVGDIVLCQQPSDRVKAQVAAMLMSKECKAHGLNLTQVDPLIIASEVLRIDDGVGFSRLPQDIKKLLSKPILAASQQSRTSLSLRVRIPRTLALERNDD